MDSTLSIDDETLARARSFAAQRRTTLEELFSEFIASVGAAGVADEFVRLMREQGGRSEPGFRFERDACHQRGRLDSGYDGAMNTEQFESRPGVMNGKLCFRGTRLPVAMILDVIRTGWDDDQILSQFATLTPEALAAAHLLLSAPEGGWEEDQVA